MKRIYLDYAASTPVDPRVFEAMRPYFSEKFGNPGSLHSFGQEAIAAIDRARETFAKMLDADFREIIFTASATEANNLALRGVVREAQKKGLQNPKIIVSAIEHESILETARDLERDGVELAYLSVDERGMVDSKELASSLDERTALVSVMYGNNEIGTVQPIGSIAEVLQEYKKEKKRKSNYPLLHTDAAQTFQFLDCDPKKLGVDVMTLSSHKIYGPKGAGALYTRDMKALASTTTGGGQEFDLRSGTENVPAIVGFAKAAELVTDMRDEERKHVSDLRDKLWNGIRKIVPEAERNGSGSGGGKNDGAGETGQTLPHILNVYFPGHNAQDILTKFDLKGLAASAGSACHSRALEPSYVIEAFGYSKERAKSSVRFSLGRPTTKEDVEDALGIIRETFSKKTS